MRNARPQALSEDGKRLIVETDDGEQIAILADARLRQLLRGERPRPQLEIEMDTELTPREIQARVRAGASVEELASASGMPTARIEAFAAPVIAEREHIAGMAQLGSVRRRGEQTGHRTLRAATAERLRERDVDPESVTWDAYKMDDGRWSVSAEYSLQDTDRQAIFFFDHRGRFSVSGNEDARWMIGEQANDPLAESTTEAEDVDTEPTVKLAGDADELALLRAVETGAIEPGLVDISETSDGGQADLHAVEDEVDDAAAPVGNAQSIAATQREDATDPSVTDTDDAPEPNIATETADTTDESAAASDDGARPAERTDTEPAAVPQEPSQLDLLYDILGNDGYSEDSVRVYDGLSDGAAVPDVADTAWQEPLDEDVPAEPEVDESTNDSASEPTDAAAEPEAAPQVEAIERAEPGPAVDSQAPAAETETPQAAADTASEQSASADTASEQSPAADESAAVTPTSEVDSSAPGPADATDDLFGATPADKAAPSVTPESSEASEPPAKPSGRPEPPASDDAGQDTLPGADGDAKPKPKPKRKRRASVPSWDEIMFGSPKNK